MKKYDATILLVDADRDFLAFVERAFRQNGVTSSIHAVHDGAEAIAYMMGEGRFSDRKTYEYPGLQLHTDSVGKLGERFQQATGADDQVAASG